MKCPYCQNRLLRALYFDVSKKEKAYKCVNKVCEYYGFIRYGG